MNIELTIGQKILGAGTGFSASNFRNAAAVVGVLLNHYLLLETPRCFIVVYSKLCLASRRCRQQRT